MRTYMQKLIQLVTGNQPLPARKAVTERDLIRQESVIGAKLFGAVPKGHRREFFCLDEHTWVWYEQWIGEDGKSHSTTTRYEVQPTGVIKVQDGHPYQAVEGDELLNFANATSLYREHVIREVYHRDHITGRPLHSASM